MIDKETQKELRKMVEEDLRVYQFRLNLSTIFTLVLSLILPLDFPFSWMVLSVGMAMVGINYFWVAQAQAILDEDDLNELF